jgi:hypothetical protein
MEKGQRAHDFDGYVAWAELWLKHPAVDWCLIPDVIDGSEQDNNDLLADWPLRGEWSVPVWHFHESIGRLEHLCSSYSSRRTGQSGEYQGPRLRPLVVAHERGHGRGVR